MCDTYGRERRKIIKRIEKACSSLKTLSSCNNYNNTHLKRLNTVEVVNLMKLNYGEAKLITC